MFGVQYSMTLQLTRFEEKKVKQEEKLQKFSIFWGFFECQIAGLYETI